MVLYIISLFITFKCYHHEKFLGSSLFLSALVKAQTTVQFPYGFKLTQREVNVGNYCPGGSESDLPISATVYSKDLVLRGLASSPLSVKFSLTPNMKEIELPFKLALTSVQLPYEFKLYVSFPLVKEGDFSRTITITTNEPNANVHQVVIKGNYLKSRCQ